MSKRKNEHSKRFNARVKAQSEGMRQADAYLKLGPHERFLLNRDREMWREIPSLTLAAIFKDIQTIEALISSGEDPDSSAPDGVTGLMYSARFGNVDAVRLFLDAGANANKHDNEFSATPLIYAAQNGQREIVKLLLDSGANPLTPTSSGLTFLHAAVGGTIPRLSRLLLRPRQK